MHRRNLLLGLAASSCVPSATLAAGQQRKRRGSPAPLPPAYAIAGHRMGVPPLIVYGVALQESKMLFGEHALPYPWTLGLSGEPRRFPSYQQAVADLIATVRKGTTNVDCGLMQVNWHWHYKRLVNGWSALDPYRNILVAAQLLREHFDVSRNWFDAVGRYHHPSDRNRANFYATSVFGRIPQIPA